MDGEEAGTWGEDLRGALSMIAAVGMRLDIIPI